MTSFVKNVTTGSGTRAAAAAGTTTTPSRPATAGGRCRSGSAEVDRLEASLVAFASPRVKELYREWHELVRELRIDLIE